MVSPIERRNTVVENETEKQNPKQAAVAFAMVRSGKELETILRENDVSDEEFTSWILDGSFRDYVSHLARGFAEADAPLVWGSLIENAKKGSVPAMKLYFDLQNKKSAARADVGWEIEALRRGIFEGGEEE
jgi:hypothetical protein